MTSDQGGGSITSVLQETRVFPPPADFASKAHIGSMAQYEALWNRAKDDPEGFWGEQARLLDWDKTWDKVLDWQPPFAKWFVGGQLNASYNCVDRHCIGPDQEQGGAHLGRRARRAPGAAVSRPAARSLEVRQRAQRPGSAKRGRRRGLHAAGSRAGDRSPGVRSDRRAAHGDLRRFQCRVALRPHPGLQGQGPGHRRRRLSPRQARPAQGERRCRRGRLSHAQARGRLPADGHAGQLVARPRPLVARAGGQRIARLPPRAARQRASSLHPLHLGIDRQTQGHPAHDRRLPARDGAHAPSGSSTSRTTTPSGARPTSAG